MINDEPKYRLENHPYQLHELAAIHLGQSDWDSFSLAPSNIPLNALHNEMSLLLPYTFGGELNQ